MLGNFTYCNPTKVYFGKDSLDNLKSELKKYGKNVLLVYGGGSIKNNGIYDKILEILKECDKSVYEDSGVMPNPTYKKLLEGVERARNCKADFILAVGGGSVCDYSKALSVSVNYQEDIWENYFVKFNEPTCKIVPVGCVLTMVGTGSEMNSGAVITNKEKNLKVGHVFNENVFPKFSILNPEFTFTLPKYQMISGIYDVMSHLLEQYFSGTDDNTTDYLIEGLLRSLIHSADIAVKNPTDYEARSNIMWTATWALNTLLKKGKAMDWEVHMLGQAVGAITNATHGMTLSAVSMPYYRYILPYGLPKFVRYAKTVWGVDDSGKTELQIAEEGLCKMEKWMKDLGLVMNLTDLGVNKQTVDDICNATFIMTGGYKVLDKKEVKEILLASL